MHVFIILMMKHTVKEVEVVWACDQKRGTLCRKECDCNESTEEKEERKRRWLDKVRDDIKEKGLSADDVYDHATWRRMLSYVDPT